MAGRVLSVEQLHKRFDEAYDRAEKLSSLIAERQGTGVDVTILLGALKEAEAEKKATLAALRMARHMQTVSYPEAKLTQREAERPLAGRVGGL